MTLTNSQVRGYLALLIVGISMIVIAAILLHPVLYPDVDHAHWADTAGKLVAPLTGLVGVVIGYYFGRRDS